jgi:hypothetical protein
MSIKMNKKYIVCLEMDGMFISVLQFDPLD